MSDNGITKDGNPMAGLVTESYHVIDRRDGERVAGGFGTLEAAEAWIEKTDRRGSGEFEARETVQA